MALGCAVSTAPAPPGPEPSAAAAGIPPALAPPSTFAVDEAEPRSVPFALPSDATLPLYARRSGDCDALHALPTSLGPPIATARGVFFVDGVDVERLDGDRWVIDRLSDEEGRAPTALSLRFGIDGFPLAEVDFGGPVDRRLYLFDGASWVDMGLRGADVRRAFPLGGALFTVRGDGLYRLGPGGWDQAAVWTWPGLGRVWSPGPDEHFLSDAGDDGALHFYRWTPETGLVRLPRVPVDAIPLRLDGGDPPNLVAWSGGVWRLGAEGYAEEPLPDGVAAHDCTHAFPRPSDFELVCRRTVRLRLDPDRGRIALDDRPPFPDDDGAVFGHREGPGRVAATDTVAGRTVWLERDAGWEALPSQQLPELWTRLVGADLDAVFVGGPDGLYRVFRDGLARVPATAGWPVRALVLSASGILTLAVDVPAREPALHWTECRGERAPTDVLVRCPHTEIWRGRPGDVLVRELAVMGWSCGYDDCVVARGLDDVAVARPPWVLLREEGVREDGAWRGFSLDALGVEPGTTPALAWPPWPAPLYYEGATRSRGFAGTIRPERAEREALSRVAQLGFAGSEVSFIHPEGRAGIAIDRDGVPTQTDRSVTAWVMGADADGRLVFVEPGGTAWLEPTRALRTPARLAETATARWDSEHLVWRHPFPRLPLTDGRTLAVAWGRGVAWCTSR